MQHYPILFFFLGFERFGLIDSQCEMVVVTQTLVAGVGYQKVGGWRTSASGAAIFGPLNVFAQPYPHQSRIEVGQRCS